VPAPKAGTRAINRYPRGEAEIQYTHAANNAPGLSFDTVVRELRKRDFAVLSTVTAEGMPDSVGVNYGVSLPGVPFGIYLMTRRHLKKAQNIVANPNVSVVVSLTRRLLWFLPPPTIHFQGKAEILDWEDEAGTRIFESFFMGRQILRKYREANGRGETRICFVRISPDKEIFTYMVGYPVWEISKRMESGAGRVKVPEASTR
jgi:nitroimidazol reductase NimA-like FMN-containing flavoprotein (pyridoxamine 5'-phosphate oxidase superfamily)